jgi:hypothetical protein
MTLSPGRLTRPVKSAGESGAAKLGAEIVAELIAPGDTSEAEAYPLAWIEEDMLDEMRANPALFWSSTSEKNKIRHERLKKAVAETSAQTAPAASAAPAETPTEESGGLSKLAARIGAVPEDEAKIRSAIAELDAAALEASAIENLYGNDDEDYTEFEWPEPEPAVEGEGS